jgi:hypothetical protein
MELKQEEDIRNYIEARLKQQGISTEREVVCGNGIRADLVTPDTVIEIKKQLNRGAIYQAHGQGVTYQKLLNKPKLLIIGLAPPSESKYQAAQRIAENIRTDGVEVVFLDKDLQWGLSTSTAPPKRTVQLPFETSSEAADKAPVERSKSDAEPKQLLAIKDMWVLILLILLFLWIKAAFWRHEPPAEPLPVAPITAQ